jgi:hypothetical protein
VRPGNAYDPAVTSAALQPARKLARRLPLPVKRAARAALRPGDLIAAERVRRSFVSSYLGDRRELGRYEQDLRGSGLLEHLDGRRAEFRAAIHASGATGYTIGAIGKREAVHLYALLRRLRPGLAVETGVANGFSTAFALQALADNDHGELYSIDLARTLGREEPGKFYEGKGRAGVPAGKEPGWLVPEPLRGRWIFINGRSQEELPGLLARLGQIDFFMHDSEHSFECMWFEYGVAWPALRVGGVLVSDDVNSTTAFPRFAAEHDRDPIPIGKGTAFLVK